MEVPTKQLRSGFVIPVFGLGTWKMGGSKEHAPDNDDEADIAAIKAAMDLGVTHIDTAEVYAAGYAESLVGRAIRGYDRSKLFLTSKVSPAHFAYDQTLTACEQSLERLQSDYLDLYLLHAYFSQVPLKDSVRALDRLVAEGLVKNIGVSNFGAQRLAEAQSHASHKIVCDQVHYNLQVREPERKDLVAYCQEQGVFLVAYRPVERGRLLQDVPDVVRRMCKKYQKTPAQVAINWLISQSHVVTIAKSRIIEHLKENLGAVGWQMEADDIEILRHDYPDQMDVSDSVELG